MLSRPPRRPDPDRSLYCCYTHAQTLSDRWLPLAGWKRLSLDAQVRSLPGTQSAANGRATSSRRHWCEARMKKLEDSMTPAIPPTPPPAATNPDLLRALVALGPRLHRPDASSSSAALYTLVCDTLRACGLFPLIAPLAP